LSTNAKGVPQLTVSPADFTVPVFATYEEVLDAAGEHYQAWAIGAANDTARSAVNTKVSGESRKLTLAPASMIDFVRGIADAITHSSIFVPLTKAVKEKQAKGLKAELSRVVANGAAMSHDDLLAIIAKLAAK
jgi:hypothetical protein